MRNFHPFRIFLVAVFVLSMILCIAADLTANFSLSEHLGVMVPILLVGGCVIGMALYCDPDDW